MSEEGTWFPGLSLGVWSVYLLEVDLELWKDMDLYRNFDGKQLASFKSGNFSCQWGNDTNASEGYILGTGIATSAMLPLLVL